LRELAPYIRSLSRRYLRSEEDVEDSLQDVLLTVHGIRHTYDPSRPFGPWILTIAKRRIADRLRRRSRTLDREVSLTGHLEALSAMNADPPYANPDNAVRIGRSGVAACAAAGRRTTKIRELRFARLRPSGSSRAP
jgi:RNA polymerase sigma factor (sigma-70 family)